MYNAGTNPSMHQSRGKASLPLPWVGNSLGSCELPRKDVRTLETWPTSSDQLTKPLSMRHLGDVKHGLEPTVTRCAVLFLSLLFLPLVPGPPFHKHPACSSPAQSQPPEDPGLNTDICFTVQKTTAHAFRLWKKILSQCGTNFLRDFGLLMVKILG